MYISLLTMTYNEEKFIRQFLEHYSFCNRVIIYDNMSNDNTINIIKEVRPDAIVISFDTGGKIDNKKFCEIKNNAWKEYKNDTAWQIVLDCDEFIHNPYTKDDVVSYLQMVRKRDVSIIPTIGFNMHSNSYTEFFHKNIEDSSFAPIYGKCCIFDPNKIIEMNYSIGAHECIPTGHVRIASPHLFLLHYKYFGYEFWKKRNDEYAARVGIIPGAAMYNHYSKSITSEQVYKEKFEIDRMSNYNLMHLKDKRLK